MNNLNPECHREDCKFSRGMESTTLAYYPPIYDKNGININPDMNTSTFCISCITCGKIWKGTTQNGKTIYQESK